MLRKNKYIIIFEGADCVGKTTIAKALARELRCSYFKNEKDKKRLELELIDKRFGILNMLDRITEAKYLLQMLKQVKFADNGIIIDRHLPSEYAYSKLICRVSDINEIFELDKEFSFLGAKIIYCFKTKYKEYRDDEQIKKNKVLELNKYFEEYFLNSSIKMYRLDTTNENLNKQIIEIIKWLNK